MHAPGLLLMLVPAALGACGGEWARARETFQSLSDNLISLDHDMYETCKHFKQYASREVLSDNAYKLEVIAPGMENAVWEVKIRHRAIYISGHYPRQRECDLTYGDIRVLPHFAQTHAAAWSYSNGVFVVAIPYKYSLDAHQLCGQWIDETLIDVRRGFPNEPIFM